MNYLVQYEADRSGCEASGTVAPLARFLISTYAEGPQANLWHEVLVCPRCGKPWGRKVWLTPTGLPKHDGWKAHEVPCNASMLSDHDFAYLLYEEVIYNRQQKEFLLDNYSRAYGLCAVPSHIAVAASAAAELQPAAGGAPHGPSRLRQDV